MEDGVEKKIEEIDIKLARIKTDTHNINRIMSLQNTPIIVNELKKIIGRSKLRAMVLHFTREEINASDLSEKLRIDYRNLSKFTRPFLGNRGYIAELNRGREKYFQRSELIDLIGFEAIPEFKEMIDSWFEEQEDEEGEEE